MVWPYKEHFWADRTGSRQFAHQEENIQYAVRPFLRAGSTVHLS